MKTKTLLIQELFEGLTVSQKLAQDIVELLREENKAITGMDIQTLTRLAKQKENLFAKIHYIDNRINQIIASICQTGNEANNQNRAASPQKRKLLDLLPLLAPNQAEVLKQYQANLSKYRLDIHSSNIVNKKMTNEVLLSINNAISLLTQQPEQNQQYGNRKFARYSSKIPSVISREV